MMALVPKRWFTWDFELEDSADRPCGEIGLSAWRERGSVTADVQQFRVSRDGWLGPFVLSGPGGEMARAVKESAFRQRFELTIEGRGYTLERRSLWHREFGPFLGDNQVGSVAPEGWLSRLAQADLPEDMPGWARAFVAWLTLLMWKRDADAAA
jgi:hypothetical protein